MRKAERLFQIITLLRGRRLAFTAKQLAEALEVSERTVYRDVQALILSGVPIEGEAGIGYRLDKSFELPPLMFTEEELLALMLGSKMVHGWGDSILSKSAVSALEKITSVLPERVKAKSNDEVLLVPDYFRDEFIANRAYQVRNAIETKRQIKIGYSDANNDITDRDLEPLGLVYWGGKWTLVAFCLLRQDYRQFRLDRISEFATTDIHFEVTDDKSLKHYLSRYE